MKEEAENQENLRLTSVEIKLAYLEDFMNKLQAIAVEQGNTIDRLTAENRVLKEKVRELLEAQEGDIPNRRPPHY
ncbi:MAG: SlyX family protein [Treponemataceae bacterium]|nr:SlyX family protein [Treponemataceae bacterium]